MGLGMMELPGTYFAKMLNGRLSLIDLGDDEGNVVGRIQGWPPRCQPPGAHTCIVLKVSRTREYNFTPMVVTVYGKGCFRCDQGR